MSIYVAQGMDFWQPFVKTVMNLWVVWFQASAAMYVRSTFFRDVTQRRVVIPYLLFGTTYRSHFQESIGERRNSSKTSCSLKMWPIGCPETSARNYHSTLRKIPEERRSQLLDFSKRGEYLDWLGDCSIFSKKSTLSGYSHFMKYIICRSQGPKPKAFKYQACIAPAVPPCGYSARVRVDSGSCY